jgi:hypothetical protein
MQPLLIGRLQRCTKRFVGLMSLFIYQVDGSLSIMYWYGDTWNISSSGTPDATGHLHNTRGTIPHHHYLINRHRMG